MLYMFVYIPHHIVHTHDEKLYSIGCDFDISHQLIKIANIRSSITTIGCGAFKLCIVFSSFESYTNIPSIRAWCSGVSFCHVLIFKITTIYILICTTLYIRYDEIQSYSFRIRSINQWKRRIEIRFPIGNLIHMPREKKKTKRNENTKWRC